MFTRVTCEPSGSGSSRMSVSARGPTIRNHGWTSFPHTCAGKVVNRTLATSISRGLTVRSSAKCIALSKVEPAQQVKKVSITGGTHSALDGTVRTVLVVGGSGRVGGSTVHWLLQFAREEELPLEVVIGGRSSKNYETAVKRIASKMSEHSSDTVPHVAYAQVDISDPDSLDAAIRDVDLVCHTAGPFQYKTRPEVLEAAIRNRCGPLFKA
eukprot:944522-Pyramimonas_sp.AAC.3